MAIATTGPLPPVSSGETARADGGGSPRVGALPLLEDTPLPPTPTNNNNWEARWNGEKPPACDQTLPSNTGMPTCRPTRVVSERDVGDGARLAGGAPARPGQHRRSDHAAVAA